MIDPSHTTVEWTEHPGDILVLPIGAFEQHAGHLPLDTDAIIASWFGRVVADHFDAALMPTLPISNSLEHAGFRGSFTFKPETLMQMVRDIADDAARQRFHMLILINCHGGNFALGPVVRDINRDDGHCKILLVHPMQFTDAFASASGQGGCLDLHAGERETSVMLHIAPTEVRDLEPGAPTSEWDVPFVRTDLNTFGFGHHSPDGYVGDYTQATAERGKQIVDQAIAGMLEHLQHRIDHLRDRPDYAGR